MIQTFWIILLWHIVLIMDCNWSCYSFYTFIAEKVRWNAREGVHWYHRIRFHDQRSCHLREGIDECSEAWRLHGNFRIHEETRWKFEKSARMKLKELTVVQWEVLFSFSWWRHGKVLFTTELVKTRKIKRTPEEMNFFLYNHHKIIEIVHIFDLILTTRFLMITDCRTLQYFIVVFLRFV